MVAARGDVNGTPSREEKRSSHFLPSLAATMPFNIPSLEDARKKKEANVSPAPQFACRKRPAPSAAGATSAAAPAPAPANTRPAMPVNPYARTGAAATSRPPVNPYAKSASSATSRSAPPASSAPSSSRPSSQPTTGRFNRNVAAAYAIGAGGVGGNRPLPPPPPDTDENPHATFSQAFGDVEDSEHYRKEVAAIGGTGGTSRNDKARAEQRAFDAAAASATASESSPTNGIPGNISARDQHIALQPHVLHVSTKQRGNAVLNYIRNVPFSYSTMVPDYIFSPNRCALFLSCKYHNLHPKYIHRRISELRTDFDLRVLLCLVDIEDNASTLLALNKLCVINNMTLILAWSNEEAARYLEPLKHMKARMRRRSNDGSKPTLPTK